MTSKLKTGTLGSAGTFAGEATHRMRELYPEFGEPSYYASMEACWEALADGTVEALVIGIERTGQPHTGREIIDAGHVVLKQLDMPLACNLYVKPGTRPEMIRRITGHGSLHQCTAYLQKHYPNAARVQHDLNSVEAAKEVMASDGSIAVVGSQSVPKMVPGLHELASKIDSGAISSWWGITTKPIFSDTPDRLVVTARLGPDGQLGNLITTLAATGFTLRTIGSFAVNEGVHVYDYLMTFAGRGKRADVAQALSAFKSARLAGAFEQRD